MTGKGGKDMCGDFQRGGNCCYGDSCRFSHGDGVGGGGSLESKLLLFKGKYLDESTLGKKLRLLCSRSRPDTVYDELSQFLEACHNADQLINEGNMNQKNSFHLACQMQADDRIPELLLQHRADVNACAALGHTALIYSAGRGRNDRVRFLLENGASTKVVNVYGESALDMGKDKLDSDVLELLSSAYAADPSELVDFRNNTDAVAAEVERSREWDRLQSISKEYSERFEGKCGELAQAFSKVHASNMADWLVQTFTELTTWACKYGVSKADRLQPLQRCFNAVVASEEAERFCDLLHSVHVDTLTLALSKTGVRDKRSVRSIQRMVVAAVRDCSTILHLVSVEQMYRCCDPDLFLLLLQHRVFATLASHDKCICKEVWQTVLEGDGGMKFTAERGYHMQVKLKDRHNCAIEAACLVELCLWAGAVQFERWQQSVESTLRTCPQRAIVGQAILKVATPDSDFFNIVKNNMQVVAPHKTEEVPACLILERFELDNEWDSTWVADVDGVHAMHAHLQQLANGASSDAPLLVGIDTEWYHDDTPSIVQIAANTSAWVLDTKIKGRDSAYREAVAAFVCEIFRQQSILVVGFSFSRDVAKLCALAPDLLQVGTAHLDLQTRAAQRVPSFHAGHAKGGLLPSLKAVCEAMLGKSLDKTYQVSNWDQRPLSAGQLQYAALDAAVLLQLYRAFDASNYLDDLHSRDELAPEVPSLQQL